MGLFDQILGAVSNPNQQGSMDQIGGIINTVQQLSNTAGTNPSTMQSVLGVVGKYVRSSLQEKRQAGGEAQAQAIVDEYSGTTSNPQAVDSLFSGMMQQQVAQDAAQRSGLNIGTIQQLLPVIVPLVLKFLQSGTNSQNPRGEGNSVLNSFLDSDRDGDVDITDAMNMASKYLGR